MNKTELVAQVRARSAGKLTQVQAEEAVNTILATMMEALGNKEPVQLTGFGSFKTSKRNARTGRNPRTGEPLEIPESRTVTFKPGKELKEMLNDGK